MASVRWGCVYAIFLSNLLAALCGGMPTYLCYAIFVAVLSCLAAAGFTLA
jgi:hypothetical protein